MIIANWKMNGSTEFIDEWINSVSQDVQFNNEKEFILCPPTCYLYYVRSSISKKCNLIKLGSQQLDSKLPVTLTGGTSSEMLVDIGCEFVIIGHSEQRMHFQESNEILSGKLNDAIQNSLRPIFCIGETLHQKNASQTEQILLEQLDAIPSNFEDKCIIAYEPVWAIGTGENAKISYIEEIHSFIKDHLNKKTNSTDYISVLYGGSVNLDNCKEIYSSNHVDGLLIGGASLDSDTITKIYNMS